MDYEKKYKDAINIAKHALDCDINGLVSTDKPLIFSMFPELKESDDERIKKKVIDVLKFNVKDAESQMQASRGVDRTFEIYACNKVIAWLEKHGDTYDYTRVDLSKFDDRIQEFSDMLEDKPKSYWDGFYEAMDWVRINGNPFKEKQGKQKSTKNIMNVWKDMRLEVYQQASGNRHEPNYSDDTTKMFSLNDIDEMIEKMSEQKPTDKVEPKFKVGDWIINNDKRIAFPTQILKIEEYGYITSCGYTSFDKVKTDYHLWTIQDAKDGDVLDFDNEGSNYHSIGIFKRIASKNELNGNTYRCYVRYGGFKEKLEIPINGDELHHCGTSARPAVKEQRDLLFQKMKESGYEWDAEKKELKKIEQKKKKKKIIGTIKILNKYEIN